ncbi:hypothetical protein [Paenibacillus sp. RC67]|uniref:hypothetical protein n=1 Tax=Paenibacillus sp. RC67 TaxID=3039392 RepID=UPI0024ACAFC1|nr:hypothetical protein [Paenibacillus sp. RC67]
MVQGLASVVAPLLSTSLYHLDKDLPYSVAAALLIILSTVLLTGMLRSRMTFKGASRAE